LEKSNLILLYEEEKDNLVYFISEATGNEEDAEDIIQEAFLKALLRYEQCESNPKSWLFTIVWNTARDRLRSKNREKTLITRPLYKHFKEMEPTYNDDPDEDHMKLEVKRLIKKEPYHRRGVLEAHFLYGKSEGQILKMYKGLTVDRIRGIIQYFRRRILETFSEDFSI